MRVMVIIRSTQESEAGGLPDPATVVAMVKFNEELMKAGVLLGADGLKASQQGKRVRFSGSRRTVIDGPFTETKELIAGFWLWRVKSIEDAVEWVQRSPKPFREDCEIEIRPLYELEDFGETLAPELRAQEAARRAQTPR